MNAIRTRQHDAVLTVELDNPPYNFLTGEMMRDLEALLHRLADDETVRAVVVTSALPGVFVSHYDVAEILAGAEASPLPLSPALAGAALRTTGAASHLPGAQAVLGRGMTAGLTDILRYHEVCRLMRRSDKVFVAAVNGHAMGGGCELVLSCDIRLMADGPYRIGQPEILVGLIPGGGGTQLLTRSLGAARALELCLEGAPIDAATARDIGLVNRLVDPDRLLAEALDTARRLARRSPVAVAAVKRAVHEGGSAGLEAGLHVERAGFLAAASQPQTRDAMRAYLADVRRNEAAGKDLTAFIEERLPDWHRGTAGES
ncbi:Probable enoyl-CoA hydratase echA8 [Nocardia otitidiscaviarum]|uniref:Probable enoyl-CoA hydratase echA8 n=1 Tax=Nocardia otitidiscaviarum TaxID=1823 RepID=A0A378Y8L6_9NOCA|nr:enoyl-CoA hydratase/isomerase family protein [Nocardia otitidiscaviarum]SUA72727.1 Probable enoyl-CoA hydratase echA8 [Nocardia otitidiscaviarum]